MRFAIAFSAVLVLAACGGRSSTITPTGPSDDWPAYGRDPGGARHSPLTDVTPANVNRLKIAWTYHTGDVSYGKDGRPKSEFETTPILVDGTLYLSTPFSRVIALDPETGAERWKYDPKIVPSDSYGDGFTSRGVATWLDPQRAAGQPCRRRVLFATLDARLIALDAATGAPCTDFGTNGQVSFLGDTGADGPGEYHVTSPPVVVGDVVVVGSAINDGNRVNMPRGTVHAFDVRTGAIRWTWDPIPRGKNDPARKTWEGDSADRAGAANAWSILSADPERDLVFIPTGSASTDHYGGERRGSNLYANSVVGLRASTGEVVWHFQVVHHDLWDYDVASQPLLVTVRRDGKEIPAVAQATKMGFVFVLNRETGEPLFPVEERPVPQTTVSGEQTWPTQPFPKLPRPLVPQRLRPEDAFGLTPWDRGRCRDAIAAARSEGIFTPPGLAASIEFPGLIGGMNWGSGSFDSERGLLVVNTSRLAFKVTLIPRDQYRASIQANRHAEHAPQRGTPYAMRREALLSPLKLPCNPPPWGTLAAVDLATGDVKWESTLGTTRDLNPLGISFNWGTPNLGGPITTASGLIFIGAAMDDYLRAFDTATGKELWKGRLPAGGQATPMTYKLRPNGKQYVVIAAGGHGKLDTRLGDSLVAFALQ